MTLQAIILGAGRGRRLGAANPGVPKPLLVVGGCTLLERQLNVLHEVLPKLDAVTFVAGYRADLVREQAARDVRICVNERWDRTNTAASLSVALEFDAQEAVLLNGDVFLDADAVRSILGSTDAALCEFKSEIEAEQVQVLLNDVGAIRRIGKDIGGVAEAVGVYRLSHGFIRSFVETYEDQDAGRYYEDVFDRAIRAGRAVMTPAPLQDGVAIEIDTVTDLEAVQGRGFTT